MHSAIRNAARPLTRSLPAVARRVALPSRAASTRAARSFYNTDISGLTEEQEEVRIGAAAGSASNILAQFRNAVDEFAQREVAPRAAEIDKSNNFPNVRSPLHHPRAPP
jgi:isovaleryl-CoA dehydrogenase